MNATSSHSPAASPFFFLDPPYTHCSATLYSPWTIADVHRLRERLASLRGKWMATLNDHSEIRAIFGGCQILAVTRPKGIGAKGADYKEIIITPA